MSSHDPNPFSLEEVTPGVSVMCAVHNRFPPMQYTLQSWLDIPAIDQIVLLDFGSGTPLTVYLDIQPTERLRIVRCNNVSHWAASRALNLAFHFTTRQHVFRVDADIILNPRAFADAKFIPQKGTFVAGNYRTAVNENDRHTNGNFIVDREQFWKIGGYDERIVTYGWEDDDLFNRLSANGLTREDFSPGALYHLHHDDRQRLRNAEKQVANWMDETLANKKATEKRGGWNLTYPRQQYHMTLDNRANNYFQVSRVE